MITKDLANALEKIGFTYTAEEKSVNGHCYALYGGYLISVFEQNGKKVAYFNFKFSENEENAVKRYDLSETFSNETAEYSVSDYELTDDGLKVVCGGSVAVFLKLIDRCVGLLIEHDIRGAEYCSVCGNKFGGRKPKKVTYGAEEHLMCEHCAVEALDVHNTESDDDSAQKGRTFKGVLLSALFGFIGTLIYIALYSLLSPALAKAGINDVRYIFCAAGALTALLVFIGYRIGCKKISGAAYVSISVFSVVFTALGQYLGSVTEYALRNGFGLSALKNKAFWLIHIRDTIPEDAADQFTSYSATFYKLLAISLLFAVVSAAICLLSLRDKALAKKEPLKIETLGIVTRKQPATADEIAEDKNVENGEE